MQDVWFAPGLTHREFDAFLQALALHDKPRPPLLAVSRGTDENTVLLLASKALFRLFGVDDERGLSARLLSGRDPGARRLTTLSQTLALEGAPRLERLRFFLGPGTEIITFLCRRMKSDAGQPVFVAAALNVRQGLIPAPKPDADVPATPTTDPVSPAINSLAPASSASVEAQRLEPPPLDFVAVPAPLATPRGAQAIQADLRARWPTSRSVRFLWRTDADGLCTMATPPLTDVVGAANADLVGRNLRDLAPAIDPSGRLGAALAGRSTWSGLDVSWPISDAAAGVSVGLGGIPAFDRNQTFEGFSGYGVIRLDQIAPRDAVRLAVPEPTIALVAADNVVPFRGKALSAEDQMAFDALGAELRGQTGIASQPVVTHASAGTETAPASAEASIEPQPVAQTDVAPELVDGPEATEKPAVPGPSILDEPVPRAPRHDDPHAPDETASLAIVMQSADARAPEAGPIPQHDRAADVARNGLAVLDKLAVGLLISRDKVPIFANRHLLDLLGFADEDALHDAGGMTHIFGGTPGNASGSEAVGLRAADGTIIPCNARMQRVVWDGLPATLLTLQAPDNRRAPAAAVSAPVPLTAEAPVAAEAAVVADPAAVAVPSPRIDARGEDEARELRAILDTATDGVAVIDGDCKVLSLNRSGEALFGCDRSEVVGKPFLSLFAPHDQDLAADYFEGLKSNATRSLLNDGREIFVKAHQGGAIPVFMTLGRLGPVASDAATNPARFCALFRDLTHWKKVERELDTAKKDAERSSALKTDFLAKVSHEIRTPLNAIIGFAEVIMEERFGPVGTDRYKDYLRDIHASGTHVMSLVNDLLDLSKIEAGRMELASEAIDANKIISECVAIMQPQASRERVIMRLSLSPRLPRIKADERSLRQIVLNLLSNAVKFNEPGGQVIVATALTEAGQAVIRIRDTGPGMSEADIVAALEPFRQLSPNAKGGTGLGLPLTKALVEANQAAFAVKSKVDHGTLVEVSFPPARVLAG